jgi:cation:H+ antiporter
MITDIEKLTPEAAKAAAWQSFWTFPSMIIAALMIAWGAESAQFLVSQAFALTILALIQTLPEFAVEGVIAWNAGKYPTASNIGLMTANFTGALRLLVGLGWPMIFTTTVLFNLKRNRMFRVARISLENEHAIEVTGLLTGSIYAFIIVIKGTLTIVDALILFAIYGIYIFILLKLPPRSEEKIEELEIVPRFILTRKKLLRNVLIWLCFICGGTGIMLVADPFLESALGLSFVLGVPAYMMIQWLAPFLSEFPEKISAFYWAKSIVKAPMSLMNMVSSGIAEFTLLIGIIPIIFCIALGEISTIDFDWAHRAEILLTATQAVLGVVILSKMNFLWFEALGLFSLWSSQIYYQFNLSHINLPLVPDRAAQAALWEMAHISILESYISIYWIWIILEVALILIIYRKIPLLPALRKTMALRS